MNAKEMKRPAKKFSIDVGYFILSLPHSDLNRNSQRIIKPYIEHRKSYIK